jgi:lambda family phage portal protein
MERAIRFISPHWGFKREMARFGLQFMASGSYRGASTGRHHDQWLPGGGSADQDLLYDLPKLRERSRDMNRNDGIASGATNAVVNNVVGSGIMPQSQINADRLHLSQERALELQIQAETAWLRWKRNADSTNRLDFDDIQALVQRQILENGEILFLPLMIPERRPYSLALELVEADRLATPPTKVSIEGMRSGIEFGKRGQPIAYHIKTSHPGSYSFGSYRIDDYTRIPAWNSLGRPNVFHLFHQLRPGQSRGVPWFAPALDIFKDLANYLETELVAARVAACYALVVTSSNPYNMATQASGGKTDTEGKPVEYLEPGIIKYLTEGENVHAFTPNRPGNTFDPFVERILRAIGVALDLPYEILAKDFSKTNYSSARAALLEARRFFQVRQIWLAKKLCQPAWEMVLEEAWLRNEFKAPDFLENKREYCKARWIPNGWQWVDPVKEANGAQISLRNNMTTLSHVLASHGLDLDETLETRARELKAIKDLEAKYDVVFPKAKTTDDQPREAEEA